MWELIRANKRDSVLLMALMAVVLLALGLVIGLAVVGPEGGLIGLGIAAVGLACPDARQFLLRRPDPAGGQRRPAGHP